MTSQGCRLGRLLISLALLTALGQSLLPRSTAAQGASGPLDLASVILTTSDLEDQDLEDYRIRGASTFSLSSDVDRLTSFQGLDEDEVTETLEDAGYTGSYSQDVHIPADPDAPAGDSARRVVTRVYAFEDDNGAEDAYELITDEGEVQEASDDEPADLGDESELTEFDFEEGSGTFPGVPYQQIELEILLDRFVLEVSALEFEESSPDVDADTVLALGERFVERAEAALEGDAPTLLNQLIQLDTGISIAPFLTYQILDGDPIRQTFETEEAFESRVDYHTGIGVESSMRRELFLTDASPYIRLYTIAFQFGDEADAEIWTEETIDRLESFTTLEDVEEVDVDPIGDTSVLAGYSYEGQEDTVRIHELYLQVGEFVLVIWIERDFPDVGLEADPETIYEIGEAQVECIEDETCTEPIPLPDSVAELVEDEGGPSNQRDEEEEEPASEEEEEPASEEEDEDSGSDRDDDTPNTDEDEDDTDSNRDASPDDEDETPTSDEDEEDA